MAAPAWTVAALFAFAANSILCRLALGAALIDAASFTTLRLASGAVLLAAITGGSGHAVLLPRPGWRSAGALFLYAVAFSFAYQSLTAGTGALLLFGGVQTTMLTAALTSGERPRVQEWTGLVGALGGLLYLLTPGISAPSLSGSVLMIGAGVSWGLYSLWGRRAVDPIRDTALNFARTLPLALVASMVMALGNAGGVHISTSGALLAVGSGAVTSGLGYVAWYTALPRLTATRAATVQLSVPVLTGAGGVLVLDETLSVRLIVAAALVLGGIGLATLARRQSPRSAAR